MNNMKLKKPIRSVSKPAEYVLPTEKSKPLTFLGGYSLLLYGRKKIGKTSLASKFEDTLFLMFEPGGKALRIYQEPMTQWLKFEKFVDLLVKDKRFKTIVIDTGDQAYDRCMEQVCKEQGITHPSDAGWGKGWNAVNQRFARPINRLLLSGKGVIFISHQKEEEIEERSGKKYHRKTNTLSGQAREALEGIVDIWANYDYDGRRRVLTILGDDFTDAGNRLEENFLHKDKTRVRQIDMGNSSQEAFDNLEKAFNNELIKEVEKKTLILKKKIGLRTTNN